MRCTSQSLRLVVVILSDNMAQPGPSGALFIKKLWQAAGVWPHPDHDPWQAINQKSCKNHAFSAAQCSQVCML